MSLFTRRDARVVIITLAAATVFAGLSGTVFVWSGLYNVAATEPHSRFVHWVLETARTRSIKTHAAGLTIPPDLDSDKRVLLGTEHFAAHCAVCHGAPGVPQGDIARGLHPPPPDLAGTSGRYTAAEMFWILKNGIKSTGMPAWKDHENAELWGLVAFMRKLPGMNEQEYTKLLMATMAGEGHQHHRGDTAPVLGETRRD